MSLINAAGFTGQPNVDACELAKADCLNGNAVLPGIVREVCERFRNSMGTCFEGVFIRAEDRTERDGRKRMSPIFRFGLPCSFYSGTKALGEEVLEGAKNCFIWRLRYPSMKERTRGITCRNY